MELIYTDEDITREGVAETIVETDVVGVVVVMDKLAVDAQYLLIANEDVVDVAHRLSIRCGYIVYPRFHPFLVNRRKGNILCLKGNHSTCSFSTAVFTTSSSA